MSNPAISIQFDGNGRTYGPGETLSGKYLFESITPGDVKTVEISVLWHSEGKGEEDMAVHEFQRLNADDGDWIDVGRPGRFSTTLPQSPLSYDGAIVKIRWCVRVRVFLYRGGELVGQRAFRLGDVPPVKAR